MFSMSLDKSSNRNLTPAFSRTTELGYPYPHKSLRTAGKCDWLDNAHRALDETVFTAYGWPSNLTNQQIPANLLAPNHQRATTQQRGNTKATTTHKSHHRQLQRRSPTLKLRP
jgi:hypothetical protein